MRQILCFTALAAVMLLSSCITSTKTARTADISASIKNATVADLRVTDQRITYTMSPSKAIQRAGLDNVKQAAIQEALTENGNADVLLEPEFVIEKERTLFGSRINRVTVSGRPAYYQNFRTLPDSVWQKPGFYGQPDVVYGGARGAGADADMLSDGGRQGGLRGLVGKLKGKKALQREDDGDLRRLGLKLHVGLMGGYSNTHYKDKRTSKTDNTDGSGFIGALGTIGIQAGSHWFLGAGSGFINSWEHSTQLVPIFGDIRYYLSSQKSSFFIDYKMGGSKQVGTWDADGGLFLSPSIGYSFGSFELAVQFMYQQFDLKGKYSADISTSCPHIGLTMGFKL